ncbi:putative DNA topoisomerase transcription factor interactor and regulator CCHC(Zn) family [Helianthus annuus]|nr:putative DNA topoisomerase transcription factor interactor and regulator CCHC(Zn) family [Helianthus annuus]
MESTSILVQEQQEHPVWGPYAQRLLDPLSGLWRNPSGGGHDDKAHPPIHPTKFSAGESRWSEDHKVTRGRGIAAPSRNDSRNNNNNNNQQQQQQATCSFCHQTGHNSSDCYSLTSQNRSARSQRVNSNSGDSPIPCPTCGSLCVLKTANTESNRGRKFYSCQTQGCKFFVCWEDSVPTTRGGGSGSATTTSRRGGRGGGGQGGGDVRFVSATGDSVSGRNCFICGDPSHFANACPNRGMRN